MSIYTKQITVHLNYLVQNKLKDLGEDQNNYVDEVLSNYFGIEYEEAYPDYTGIKKWTGVK